MITSTFPVKLYRMLELADKYSKHYDSIITAWQDHGRCFRIHDKKRLEEELLHLFFNTMKYSSFRRSLNHWGFRQIQGLNNPDKGCYYHPMFLRTQYELCALIKRKDTKNSTSSSSLHDDDNGSEQEVLPCYQEPMFHSLPPMPSYNHQSRMVTEGIPSSSSKPQEEHGYFSSECSSRNLLPTLRNCKEDQITDPTNMNINVNQIISGRNDSRNSMSENITERVVFSSIMSAIENPDDFKALHVQEKIPNIVFEPELLEQMKALLPDDPRTLCNVFDW